ncbi:2-C-methyl-D-erythritol 4-phosphate cytidylyltransferase [Spiroplasma chinense]|uniref:2-C-methyl-D-erythritol 4-phosphate cytidylyltransferase n=1 Tax=Spiroplasma chinense TaxID=216932 RepID=A0A5B9Y2I4_9MOLU|nr:IspD/TarI family cytidylyltransferase [Spiroplasma chinense]QEH61220.1 2-C-methyl-D-erythritol 4-phosphate cytidylyltransferase [Spiroplasma chinense]
MIDVIILAAGTSQRFGSDKLLEIVEGKKLLTMTISAFENTKEIKKFIIVGNKNNQDWILDFIKEKGYTFVLGGETRSESVSKGLEKVESDFVLIHDGARPFVSTTLIKNISTEIMTKDLDCVVPVLKVTNCLKNINGKVTTVDRDDFVMSQTPQAFKTVSIKKEFENFDKNWFDDCQALEGKSYKIQTIQGDLKNIKITYKDDIINLAR